MTKRNGWQIKNILDIAKEVPKASSSKSIKTEGKISKEHFKSEGKAAYRHV